MQPRPLIAAEVQRIRTAFHAASVELAAALTAMSEADLDDVAPGPGQAAVSAGLADLHASLRHLRATADECVTATGRHVGRPDRDLPLPGER